MKKLSSIGKMINTKLGIDLLIAYFGVNEIPNLIGKLIDLSSLSKIALNVIGLVGLYLLQDILKRKDTLTLGLFLVVIDLISGSISGLLPGSMQDYINLDAVNQNQLAAYSNNNMIVDSSKYKQAYLNSN